MVKYLLTLLLLSSTALAVGTVTGGNYGTRKGVSTFTQGDAGQVILGVRNDGDSVLTPNDLTYGPLSTDNTGKLKVSVTVPAPVGAATLAEQQTQTSVLTNILFGQSTANVSLAQIQNSVANAATLAEQVTQTGLLTTIDQKLGSSLVVTQGGKTMVAFSRTDYAVTNVTTAAYVQILAPQVQDISEVELFDSCGETLVLALGDVGLEVDQLLVTPGGNGRIPFLVPSNTRVSLKAVSNDCTLGENSANFYH